MRERSRNWEKRETKYLVQLKDQMQSRFKKSTVKHRILWQEISENMKERGYGRSAEECIHKWRNLVRGCKNGRENKRLGDVYTEVEKLCNAQSGKSGKCFSFWFRFYHK